MKKGLLTSHVSGSDELEVAFDLTRWVSRVGWSELGDQSWVISVGWAALGDQRWDGTAATSVSLRNRLPLPSGKTKFPQTMI